MFAIYCQYARGKGFSFLFYCLSDPIFFNCFLVLLRYTQYRLESKTVACFDGLRNRLRANTSESIEGTIVMSTTYQEVPMQENLADAQSLLLWMASNHVVKIVADKEMVESANRLIDLGLCRWVRRNMSSHEYVPQSGRNIIERIWNNGSMCITDKGRDFLYSGSLRS